MGLWREAFLKSSIYIMHVCIYIYIHTHTHLFSSFLFLSFAFQKVVVPLKTENAHTLIIKNTRKSLSLSLFKNHTIPSSVSLSIGQNREGERERGWDGGLVIYWGALCVDFGALALLLLPIAMVNSLSLSLSLSIEMGFYLTLVVINTRSWVQTILPSQGSFVHKIMSSKPFTFKNVVGGFN